MLWETFKGDEAVLLSFVYEEVSKSSVNRETTRLNALFFLIHLIAMFKATKSPNFLEERGWGTYKNDPQNGFQHKMASRIAYIHSVTSVALLE